MLPRIFRILPTVLALGLGVACSAGAAAPPAGYPASYAETIAAAGKEGKVVIYSATDANAVQPLIKDFESLYPGIKVEYNDMNSTEIYNRFISEVAGKSKTADVMWSSAMDLQMKLVNDGYALSYESPEVKSVPDWSVWKNEAYGTTYEPVVILYNKRLLQSDEIPQSHADLAKILAAKAERFRGKVTTYDVVKSGVGFMLATQDAKVSSSFWDLAKSLGATWARFQTSTGTMMERVSSGEYMLAYNVLGSYALAKSKKDPSLAFVYPNDYSLVLSRVMFVNKTAANPNAAKLWLDYVLSKRGQTLIATQADLYSLRNDVEGEATAAALTKKLGNALKPIPVSPALIVYLDQAKRVEFLGQWQQTAVKR